MNEKFSFLSITVAVSWLPIHLRQEIKVGKKKRDFEFKIEFLLPSTGCRKMLGKMPGIFLFWQ